MAQTQISMQKVSPNIFVKDIRETINFYRRIGFELTMNVGEGDEMVWAMVGNGEVTFMFQTFKSIEASLPVVSRADGGSLLLYINMKGVREYFEQVKGVVPILQGLEKTFYGATEFSIEDNNHYMLTFAEHE
jgi:uncharacterized glyoxalase superfamily protein PhnB